MSPRHASETFDTGAQDFERLAPALWNPMGNAVAAAADISLGDRVLDAYCGSGASTIPAAQSAGPDGAVDAVDPSSGLLDLARSKAEAMSLDNVRFTGPDLPDWTTDAPYDVVLCCYGLFLFPDMAAGTAALARLLRPGGKIALSTWDEGAYAPFRRHLEEACIVERPELTSTPPLPETANMELLASREKLRGWLLNNGFTSAAVDSAPFEVPLDSLTAWSLVQGTGLHALLPTDPAALERVREDFLDRLGDGFVLNAHSLIAVAATAQE